MTKRRPARNQSPDLRQQAEDLPVRRDMVTLLTYVQDNKVVGTQSTGNLPLKVVRAVTAQFVNPPKLDTTLDRFELTKLGQALLDALAI